MSVAMFHAKDPREDILKQVSSRLDGIEIFNNQVLVATYIRPEKTRGGLIINTGEDRFQSKIGLVLKRGNAAFVPTPDSPWFQGVEIHDGDWVLYRPNDGWEMEIGGCLCRIFDDTAVRGRVADPDSVF